MVKFIIDSDFSEARRIVYQEIEPIKDTAWWDRKDIGRLEAAAFLVCGRYNSLSVMLDFDKIDLMLPGQNFRDLFWKNGAHARAIIRTHDILESFLDHRRKTVPDSYLAYSRLRAAAVGKLK